MKTHCFKIYYLDIDVEDIVYIGASSKQEAIKLLKEEYSDEISDFKYLGIE